METLRISSPVDLVAYIPYRLGFRPRESVVLLGLRGPRAGLGLISRVDLADLGNPVIGRRMLMEMSTLMAQDGSDDVFVVLYSDLPRSELGRDTTVRTALENLRQCTTWADEPGPWVVSSSAYGCWGTGEHCAPATADVTDLEHGAMAATMVLQGHSVATRREELGVPRSRHAARRRTALRATGDARRLRRDVEQRCHGGEARPGVSCGLPDGPRTADQQELVAAWREDERRRWQRLVAFARCGAVLPAAELGRMAVGLEDDSVRDGVLCSLIGEPPPQVPSPVVAAWTLGQAMTPGGPPPDPERTEPGAAVLRELAATVPRRSGARALGLLAWLAWWCGDGARADVLAQQALAARPGTRLAELVDQALQARVPPGWVREGHGPPRETEAIG